MSKIEKDKTSKKDKISTDSLTENVTNEAIIASPTTSDEENIQLDSQTLDMLKRIRDQKLTSGGKDPFFVSEKEKHSGYEYRWASTDKDTPESVEYLKDIGWKVVEGFREITTGGYTVNGQPGKHILMRLSKVIYNELIKIQNELNERKRNAVFGKEVLSRDGGKNVFGSSTKVDESAKNDFLNNL